MLAFGGLSQYAYQTLIPIPKSYLMWRESRNLAALSGQEENGVTLPRVSGKESLVLELPENPSRLAET